MNVKKLNNAEAFFLLKKGEKLLIEWGDGKVELLRFDKIHPNGKEVLFQGKGNKYFIIEKFLDGSSWVKEVIKVWSNLREVVHE